jgi:hypothetical protein
MMNPHFIPHKPPRFARRKTLRFKFDLTLFIFGAISLSLPFIVGWERLMSIKSSRGGSVGEGVIAGGVICIVAGVLDFAIRFIIYVFKRIYRS